MRKLSKRQQIKKISKRQDDFDSLLKKIRTTKNPNKSQIKKLIELMKAKMKEDPALKEKFKEYKVSINVIDHTIIDFIPLEVSAKTKNKKIYLNENMLHADSEVKDVLGYAIHEGVHLAQQISGNIDGHEKPNYLDKDTEIEAFQLQIDHKKRNEGEKEAEKYVDDLLDYHKITNRKKRKLKEKQLLGK